MIRNISTIFLIQLLLIGGPTLAVEFLKTFAHVLDHHHSHSQENLIHMDGLEKHGQTLPGDKHDHTNHNHDQELSIVKSLQSSWVPSQIQELKPIDMTPQRPNFFYSENLNPRQYTQSLFRPPIFA